MMEYSWQNQIKQQNNYYIYSFLQNYFLHSSIILSNMKIIKLLLIIVIKNAFDQTVSVKINQSKGFDQIFGQRWDGGAEENICRIDQIIHGETADQNQNDQQFDQVFDELEVKKEESEEMSTNSDQLKQLPENIGQISDQIRILKDKQKREIVEKFHKIKEKIKQKGKKYYSVKEWNKIERKIATKLGANQKKIYKWKREFGMMIKISYSDEKKLEILKQFDNLYDKLKMKLNEKLERKRTKCQKIIAKHLGISLISIYKWKKQLKNGKSLKNHKIDDEKREIVEKYFKTKNEFMQIGKHSRKEWKEFGAEIKQIFGISERTIERWAKKIGINQNVSKGRKVFKIAEKIDKMKQYYKMKKQNSELTDREIAAELGIPMSSLKKYKSKLMGDAKKF